MTWNRRDLGVPERPAATPLDGESAAAPEAMPRYQLREFLEEWAADQQDLPPELAHTMADMGLVSEPMWRRWRALMTRQIVADT
jgi:hypothetical protein